VIDLINEVVLEDTVLIDNDCDINVKIDISLELDILRINEDVIDLKEDNVLVIVDDIVRLLDIDLRDVRILVDIVLAVK